MRKLQKRICTFLFVLVLIGMIACSKAGGDLILGMDGQEIIITKPMYEDIEKSVNVDEEEDYDLPLDYLFYDNGATVVENIEITDGEVTYSFAWDEIAEATFWRNTRKIEINDEEYLIDRIDVHTGGFEEEVDHSITDIPYLTAEALHVEFGERSSGFELPGSEVEHVVWIFLDGFGYEQFQTASTEGLIPILSNLGAFYPAYTIFPPKTSTVTAALLSGLDSTENGVWVSGIRNIEVPNIIEAITGAGMEMLIVEGSSTPFNYPNAEITLSGDRDGNGSTDDNVYTNAEAALTEGIPELFMVHFHGIDDVGHTYAPYSEEWEEKVAEVDEFVGKLIELLPEKTLVVIFPDHGMHRITGDSELGNHGSLILDDMGIYIILFEK